MYSFGHFIFSSPTCLRMIMIMSLFFVDFYTQKRLKKSSPSNPDLEPAVTDYEKTN